MQAVLGYLQNMSLKSDLGDLALLPLELSNSFVFVCRLVYDKQL